MKGLCLAPVLLAILVVFISECRPKSVTAESSSSSTQAESYKWTFLNQQKTEQHGRHKRFVVTGTALLAAIGHVSSILGILDFGKGVYDDVTESKGAQHHKDMEEVKLKLQDLDGKIDSLKTDVDSLKKFVSDGHDRLSDGHDRLGAGQERLKAAILYGRGIARLSFFFSYLNNFLTLQNDSSLAPAGLANTWADGVLDLGEAGVAQVLHDFHDMVMGRNPLFGHKPIFVILENGLDRNSRRYWQNVIKISKFLDFIQVSGYAAWYTALNIKARHMEVANVQRMALTRLSEQERIMKPLLLEWPSGTYALPMTDTGCPLGPGTQWRNGSRLHDTQNSPSSHTNGWTSGIHFPQGSYASNDMTQHFCSKTEEGGSGPWPKGCYCIFMKDGKCPTGFSFGFIRWDDEDTNNHNTRSGSVPEGQYDRNTIIFYCCRSDRSASTPIDLPNRKSFYLLKYGSKCQQVRGMKVRNEYFYWNNEDDNNKQNWKYGAHPSAYFYGNRNHIIRYCYYHL